MSSATSTSTRAFAPFEWMVALRYLRARRKEGFISVIAGFSFIGIMLGVATLIIVMAVMNGFRQELFDKMLGLNGHVVVHSLGEFTDYDEVANRIREVDGVKYALPLVEGQVLISTPFTSSGAFLLREASSVAVSSKLETSPSTRSWIRLRPRETVSRRFSIASRRRSVRVLPSEA